MTALLNAFWRAVAYCLLPRVMLLSISPLIITLGLAFSLGWVYWEDAISGVRSALEASLLINAGLQWLNFIGAEQFRAVMAPLIVVALAVPVLVVFSLFLVSVLMTPSLVSLVARRRFAELERRKGAAFWQGALWSLGCSLLALLMLAVSLPLWLLPPLALLIPTLVWGWLTWQVMAFDVLAEHASVDERRELMRRHRWPLLTMGVITGLLGAAPSLVWAFSALTLVFAPLLIGVSIWLYTLVFAFSALWFAHYLLAALEVMRRDEWADVLPPDTKTSPSAGPPAGPSAGPPAGSSALQNSLPAAGDIPRISAP